MAHSFTIKFNGDLNTLLPKVRDKIIGEGGSFKGDTTRGSFSGETPLGAVFLDYETVSDSAIRFTVTDKPFLVPNSTIESTVRGYLS
jgi:hypothetical protein